MRKLLFLKSSNHFNSKLNTLKWSLAFFALINIESNAQVITSQTTYVKPEPAGSGVLTTPILSVGEAVSGYKMVGIPDGLGAYDNNDGTFTLLMNHEIGNTSGIARAHGAKGAFVSKWVIRKSDLNVMSGSDLITSVYNWNKANQASETTTTTFAFNRFCSADLPEISAFYNASTGKGTQNRIFMNGEEGGTTGYAVGTVVTGPDAGKAYILGKFGLITNDPASASTSYGSWENILANPFEQDKTVAIGNNDGGSGTMAQSVAVYVGTKTNTGSEVDKAGLTNGVIKFVNVTGVTKEIADADATTRATNITSGTAFTLSATSSTAFSRPEDGAWDPKDPTKYYFVTTDRIDTEADGLGTQKGRSRLWRLNFTDITNPDLGGTIDLLLNGTEGQNMFDNICVDKYGFVILLEDVGNNAHNGKIWQYNIVTKSFKMLTKHDTARFGDAVAGVTTAATAPFNIDEESSGVIDVSHILGSGNFLFVDQAHYLTDTETVEGGQLLRLYNPDSYNATLDIKEFVSENSVLKIKAYPNPFDNEGFSLSLPIKKENPVEFIVYDMNGKLVESQKINITEENNLKIGKNYSQGVYNVVIRQGDNTRQIKVIKK